MVGCTTLICAANVHVHRRCVRMGAAGRGTDILYCINDTYIFLYAQRLQRAQTMALNGKAAVSCSTIYMYIMHTRVNSAPMSVLNCHACARLLSQFQVFDVFLRRGDHWPRNQ